MKFLRQKRILIPLVLVTLYALVGFLVVPAVARAQAEARLPALLKRPVSIKEVAFNPFTLAVTIRGFAVTEASGAPFIAFDELFVDVSFWRLIRGRVALDAIRLVRPAASVTLLANGDLSFADLLPKESEPPAPEPEKKASTFTLTINALDITDGAFTFNDQKRAEPFTATLQPLALSLRDFTTEAGRNSQYAFTAKLGDATLSYDGDFSATPLRSSGKLSMQGIRLDAFQPYVAEQTRLIVAGGVAGIEARYQLDGSVTPLQFKLEDGRLGLDGLNLGGEGLTEPLFTLARLAVNVKSVDLATKHVEVKDVVLEKGVLHLLREKSAAVQLARLAKRDVPAAPAPVTPSVVAPAPTTPDRPWTASLGRFALEQWALTWADQSLEYPTSATLDQLDLELTRLDWPLEGSIDTRLSFRWMDKGQLAISGPLTPKPLGGALHVELTDFSLAPFDGYLWEYALNGTLKRGALTTRLDANFSDGGAQYAVKGDVSLRDLSILDGDDRPLFDFRAIDLVGLDVKSSPSLALKLDTLTLAGTTLRVERDAQGELNVSKLSKPPKPGAAEPAPEPKGSAPATPLVARIGAVQLDDFNVDWLDRTTKPAFATSIKRLSGKRTQLTSPTTQRIGVSLAGRIDQAPLKVKGALLPRGKASDGSVVLSLEGYDLPRATPYSVQYVAQPIARGKLGVELDWKLGAHKVNATNRVLVDQLDFGPVVSEPDPKATQLPLGLAVAVLSDRTGRIDLQLPMSGDLDDPEFKWGGMVLQTLKNLLEKVATAPFTLVAGLFAGKDPDALKSISFVAGDAQAVGEEAAKIDSFVSLLTERPLLKLELTPGVDPVTDREVLARRQLRASLTPRRSTMTGDAGVPGLDDAEYQRLVAAAWRKATGADAGVVEFAQMENELLSRQVISDEALEGLRRDRAAWVQSALGDRGVEVSRVFIVGTTSQSTPAVAIQLK